MKFNASSISGWDENSTRYIDIEFYSEADTASGRNLSRLAFVVNEPMDDEGELIHPDFYSDELLPDVEYFEIHAGVDCITIRFCGNDMVNGVCRDIVYHTVNVGEMVHLNTPHSHLIELFNQYV